MVTYTLTGLKSIYTAEIQTLAYTKVLEQTLVPVSKFLCAQHAMQPDAVLCQIALEIFVSTSTSLNP